MNQSMLTRGTELELPGAAYKILAVKEMIETPEQARELSQDAFSGMRIIIEDVAEFLLNVAEDVQHSIDRVGYKLKSVAELMDTETGAAALSQDSFSGIRLILEDAAEVLLNVPVSPASASSPS
jgi:hypothetical protein